MEEERKRGMTIDTNEKTIKIGKKRIHFIDTPGHTDFIFSAMKVVSQVDVAILLVDAFHFIKDFSNKVSDKFIVLI